MDNDIVLLAHGSGGELSHELVERLFVKHFSNPILARLEDAAVLDAGSEMGDAGLRTQPEDLLALASRFVPPVSCFEHPAS